MLYQFLTVLAGRILSRQSELTLLQQNTIFIHLIREDIAFANIMLIIEEGQ